MKIAIIGATGFVGSALLTELQNRGHHITAIARKTDGRVDSLTTTWMGVDVNRVGELAKSLAACELVISAFNAGWTNPNLYEDFIKGAKSIQEAVKEAGVKRLIVVGGGGSLYVAPGVQAVDTPDFPAEYHTGANAARDYLSIIKNERELDWAFFSPALEMHPGITTGRTGTYRLGLEQPVFDADGHSSLSVEDTAVALADEAERGAHRRLRFTAGY